VAHAAACSKAEFDCDEVGQPATAMTGDSRNPALPGEIEASSGSCRGHGRRPRMRIQVETSWRDAAC